MRGVPNVRPTAGLSGLDRSSPGGAGPLQCLSAKCQSAGRGPEMFFNRAAPYSTMMLGEEAIPPELAER